MLKSFVTLKMLYGLKTWTQGQEISCRTIIAVCIMEVIIFFLIILKRLPPVKPLRKEKFKRGMNIAILLIGCVAIIVEAVMLIFL